MPMCVRKRGREKERERVRERGECVVETRMLGAFTSAN